MAAQLRRGMGAALGAARTAFASRGFASMAEVNGIPVEVHNEGGSRRVVVTKELPGTRWIDVLTRANCRIEVCKHPDTILSNDTIKQLIGDKADGVLGQLTEDWSEDMFAFVKGAGVKAFSTYAVGYNNVDVAGATKNGIPVGNTPGVLTETTAEIAAALTLAAARRVVEADEFMRSFQYKGWLPTLFVGALLQGKTVGIIGAGRIGSAYARMMVEGHKMNLLYADPYQNKGLESYVNDYGKFLASKGEKPVTCERVSVEDLLKRSDVVSLHMLLDASTRHTIDKKALGMMKKDAILVNAARGPVIDEVALVEHLRNNPEFRCGLDVFEDEPEMKPGLEKCKNAVIVPHIASATLWTRGGMATLAAANIAGRLEGWPVWSDPNNTADAYVDGAFDDMPKASPSIVNAADLGIPKM
ncbi:unnamed protein product [Pedinophyceae sp. YPF-701]|nr:unnamed protein product [Pedinophyceae sp. YPF-701]